MLASMNCIIVDADQGNCAELGNFLSRFGVNLIGQYQNVDPLHGLLGRADSPQLVIINLDPHAHETLKKIGHLPRQFPQTSFFLMSSVLDPQLLMEAMRLGVREFIPLPMSGEQLATAIDRFAQAFGNAKKARIIQIVPTIGGCGSTTLACNLAASLAKHGKTVLIDMDLMRGGVASSFDIRARYTIADVMDSADKVDRQFLDNALTVHKSSSVSILGRPELPEDTLRINQTGLNKLLGILGRMFDFVVVDSLRSISPIYSSIISASDVNIVVMQLNVPSARNAERLVSAMRRMGIDQEKIKIVVNRFVKKGLDIERSEVERALGLKISWLVPNDFKNAIAAINYGEPVVLRAPKSEMSTSLEGLAKLLSSKAPSVDALRQVA
jgi:pilus assembly protein CpaE